MIPRATRVARGYERQAVACSNASLLSCLLVEDVNLDEVSRIGCTVANPMKASGSVAPVQAFEGIYQISDRLLPLERHAPNEQGYSSRKRQP